jgi:exopolyphosphatase/pppGpp-phosphohydrolase
MSRDAVTTGKVSSSRKLAPAAYAYEFPDIESEIRRRYAALRVGPPDGKPITLLHIGTEQTTVASGSGAEPEAILMLAIGARKTAVEYFKHQPPTPGELENAILTVEDEVIRARTLGKDGSTLFSTDAAIREIALLAGVPDRPELILGLEAMERIFERLAAITLGRPAAHEGLPSGATFAATLLILREFMHHLKFSSITVTA